MRNTVSEERVRKTAPGLKNSLSLLKMSVQLGAAFTSIKTYKNITPTVCLRHDKNMWTHSLSQSTDQYDVGNRSGDAAADFKVKCDVFMIH
jgi:hypothetical protein